MVTSAHNHDGDIMHGHSASSGILFEQTEFDQMGKAFLLGKYAIHWHMHGDVSGQYIKGCAIHRSYNRALTGGCPHMSTALGSGHSTGHCTALGTALHWRVGWQPH
jgi:hypothetical protein